MSDIDSKLRRAFEEILSRFEDQLGGKIATLVDYSDEYIVVVMDDPNVVPGRTLKINKKTKKVSAFIPSKNLEKFSQAARERSARFTKTRKAPLDDDFEDDKNTLAHHGIKGQKWGVRRFQNLDGSWTKAGAERYGKGSSGKIKRDEEKQRKPGNADTATKDITITGKQVRRRIFLMTALSSFACSRHSITSL